MVWEAPSVNRPVCACMQMKYDVKVRRRDFSICVCSMNVRPVKFTQTLMESDYTVRSGTPEVVYTQLMYKRQGSFTLSYLHNNEVNPGKNQCPLLLYPIECDTVVSC